MPQTQLQTAVVKTLAFFDIFSRPLTALEVWRYLLGQPAELAEVIQALESSSLVAGRDGFYFLANAEPDLVFRRQQRYLIAEKKYRRAMRFGRVLAALRFVRLIAVCNSLADSNAQEESDIDLFVVAARGKVWTVRFVCLLVLKLLGLRPTPIRRQDKFCLSFLVDETQLNLQPLALPRNDIYFYYWIQQLYPLYDAGGVYQRLLQANAWTREFLPNSQGREAHPRRTITLGWLGRSFKAAKEFFSAGAWLENLLQKIQLKKLPAELKKQINQGPGVVIRPGVIKLIANDRREGYRNEWVTKVNQLLEKES